MVNNNFSCIKEVTINVPISLSIAYQANEITGVSDVLESWKRQYIQILQGIVVNYKNVSLLTKYAYIKYDYPVIICNVKATFELFTPTVGSIVKGVVNRISHDYIGCLVHNTINVTINRSHNTDDASNFIGLDNVILFETTHLGFKRKIIRVRGKITQECVNLMKKYNFSTVEFNQSSNNRVLYTSNESSEDTDGGEFEKSDDTSIKKLIQMESLLCSNANLVGTASDYSSNFESYSPKKKRKGASKSQNEKNTSTSFESVIENDDESQSLLDDPSILIKENFSDASQGTQKKKKKKSSKRSHSEVNTNDLFESSSNKIDMDDSILLKEKITTDSSCNSPKKKKLKLLKCNLDERNLTFANNDIHNICVGDNSTDTSSQHSSSKKKKHKKSKKETPNSPSIFSDSLSSKDEIEPFKVPVTPLMKKNKKSQSKFSPCKEMNNVENFTSLLSYKDILRGSLSSSVSSLESSTELSQHKKEMIKDFPSYQSIEKQFLSDDIALNNSTDLTKKAKKRKRQSFDKDGLPKKKNKLGEKKSKPVKTSSKHKGDKTKKISKDKSEKDRKKKPKKKVISSKKKLPKLKKKKKEKTEKLKKRSKKSSKLKEKDVL